MNEQILRAIELIRNGRIVILPTDTAFGICCRIDNEKAVQRLFTLRKRPETQATPVLVSNFDMAQEYLQPIPDEVKEKLMDKYWPGGLTIVLPCQKDKVLNLVSGGGNNLGVRIPNNQTALEIIKNVGVPILGPSANFHGEVTPFRLEDLDPELVGVVDYVVPGECTIKQASTVIDCSINPWKILREGAVEISI